MTLVNPKAEVSFLDLLDVYLLNLMLTLAMFTVLVFRAWIEFKNYSIMWREFEWKQTYNAMARILKSDKEMFSKAEGGEELYQLLCRIFKVDLE